MKYISLFLMLTSCNTFFALTQQQHASNLLVIRTLIAEARTTHSETTLNEIRTKISNQTGATKNQKQYANLMPEIKKISTECSPQRRNR